MNGHSTLYSVPKAFKTITFLFILFSNYCFAQVAVDEINATNGKHFITTTIDYPITGTYFYEGDKEPIVVLNPNGSGVFQQHDLSKSNISWGIECTNNGSPVFKKGFNYAVYTLWYKILDNATNNWISAHYAIHFEKKKMFILGERSKDYVDKEEE